MAKEMEFTARIEKWGNAYGIRIPQRIVKALNLKLGEPILVRVEPLHTHSGIIGGRSSVTKE